MRVELNNAGFRALRTDPKVRAFVHEQAERLAKKAGRGVEAVETSSPRNRARSAIVGSSRHQDAMLRALGGSLGEQS
jgi:hypothetical protein